MSLISFSPIQDGVTGVNASATNTPLSTIYNDYNGNITNANIASNAAIAGSKIAPASLPLAALVLSQANAGTAGGTFYYINLGGIKLLWARGSAQAIGGAGVTTLHFTLPTFFTTLQSVIASVESTGNLAYCFVTGTPSITDVAVDVETTGATSAFVDLFLVGT